MIWVIIVNVIVETAAKLFLNNSGWWPFNERDGLGQENTPRATGYIGAPRKTPTQEYLEAIERNQHQAAAAKKPPADKP